MAAAVLPAPGTPLGPCTAKCIHRDCAETRRDAERPCRICTEPIGYERRFYRDWNISTGEWAWVHAVCLEADMAGDAPGEGR